MANILNGILNLSGYIILAVIVLIGLKMFAGYYKVVPPHQAHVVVTRGKGRRLYSSREGSNSSYFFVPFLMRRSVIPLENIKMEINDIPLRDSLLAKFSGDVRVYLNVIDPIVAAERLGKIVSEEKESGSFPMIETDVKDLIQAITRNSSMKLDVFTIMKERDKFSKNVEEDCNKELVEWGLRLVDLEVIHFSDIPPNTVIADLEARQAKIISTETRKQIAQREKEAQVVEAVNQQEQEVQKAKSEQEYRVQQIVRDEEIGKRDQLKNQNIAEQQVLANQKTVDASRTLTVGTAEYEKQKTIINAEATAQARSKIAEGEATYTRNTGYATADVTKASLLAEAEGTDKKAEALQKYNEAGLTLEMIRANITIKQAQFNALGLGLQKANINLVTSGESNILGIPIGAEVGADLGAMLVSLQNMGVSSEQIMNILKSMPLEETVKLAIGQKAGLSVAEKAIESEKKKS